jgi:hypothetical protein
VYLLFLSIAMQITSKPSSGRLGSGAASGAVVQCERRYSFYRMYALRSPRFTHWVNLVKENIPDVLRCLVPGTHEFTSGSEDV